MFPYTEAQCKHGGTDDSTSCTNYYNYYYFPQCDLVAYNGRSKKNIKSMNINTKATSGLTITNTSTITTIGIIRTMWNLSSSNL